MATFRELIPFSWGAVLGLLSLVVTAGLSAFLILGPLVARSVRKELRSVPGRLRSGFFFASIGLGYMVVELLFLSRFLFVLPRPAVAASVVLAGFLLGSGLGSLAAGGLLRRGVEPGKVTLLAGLAVAVGTPLLLQAQGQLFVPLAALGAVPRALGCLGLVSPLAFAMGMLFPAGLRQLDAWQAPALLPWAYALNGYASAVAPSAVALAAPCVGHWLLGVAGSLLYLVAALALTGGGKGGTQRKRVRRNGRLRASRKST